MQVIGLVYRPYQVVQTTETQVDTRVSGDTAVVYLVCQMEMNYCSRGYPNSQSVLISPTSLPPHTHTHTHTPTHPHTHTQVLSIVLNLLGFSVPIPLCLWEGIQAQHIALLGYIPPALALFTIIGYVIA